jgi:hypothetical protein
MRRRPSPVRHVLRRGGLADIHAEPKEFTVDAGSQVIEPHKTQGTVTIIPRHGEFPRRGLLPAVSAWGLSCSWNPTHVRLGVMTASRGLACTGGGVAARRHYARAGAVFRPHLERSPWMRFNVTVCDDSRVSGGCSGRAKRRKSWLAGAAFIYCWRARSDFDIPERPHELT